MNWIPRTFGSFFVSADHWTSTPANFVLGNAELEQDADRDHEAVALLSRGLEVRRPVGPRRRDEHAALHLELLLGLLEADVRQVVEATVVQPADVGDERDLDRRLLRRRPSGAPRARGRARRHYQCRERHESDDSQQQSLSGHMPSLSIRRRSA